MGQVQEGIFRSATAGLVKDPPKCKRIPTKLSTLDFMVRSQRNLKREEFLLIDVKKCPLENNVRLLIDLPDIQNPILRKWITFFS